MDFKQAIETCLRTKYADFSGRASRAEFWWFALFTFIVMVVLDVIVLAVQSSGILLTIFGLVFLVVAVGLIVPSLAAIVRRLHDTGKSGWLFLLVLIPLVGGIVLLVFYLLPSDAKANAYGEPPA